MGIVYMYGKIWANTFETYLKYIKVYANTVKYGKMMSHDHTLVNMAK